MTEPTAPLIPENDNDAPEPSSPWVMLVSMILLIGVLILSSAMLLQYVAEKGGDTEDAPPDLAAFLEQGKALAAGLQFKKAPGDSDVQESEDSDSSGRSFFGGSSGSVRWPKLKLTGFGTSTDEEGGFAIINGKQVLVNTYIGDVKLVEIRSHGAVVEYKGEQKILAVDHTR